MSVLPNKYVPLESSILGVASIIAASWRPNDTVSTLWDRVSKDERVRTYDRYADALTLLFAGGIVEFNMGKLKFRFERRAQ